MEIKLLKATSFTGLNFKIADDNSFSVTNNKGEDLIEGVDFSVRYTEDSNSLTVVLSNGMGVELRSQSK